MKFRCVGYRATKYGYELYGVQEFETEEQIHIGKKVLCAYTKLIPVIDEVYTFKYYKKNGKYYAF